MNDLKVKVAKADEHTYDLDLHDVHMSLDTLIKLYKTVKKTRHVTIVEEETDGHTYWSLKI